MNGTLPLYTHFRDALDRAQAHDIQMERVDQLITETRLSLKNVQRRAARHIAQIELARRMRQCGVQYQPEYDNLDVDTGDGTHPQHYHCRLHGLAFALGDGDALVVWNPAAAVWRPLKVWDMLGLGHALELLTGRLGPVR